MNRILIIEDDQLVATIYRNKFSSEGFAVATAPDGESGFELIQSFRPEVVILDLMLPKLTGLELLKKIRSQPGSEKLPVIVFSNTYLSSMVQAAWEAGATKCLSKANCTPGQAVNVVRGLFPRAAPIPVRPGQAAVEPAAKTLPAAAEAGGSDAHTRAELRRTLPPARATFTALEQSVEPATRINCLHELYCRVHTLTGKAGAAGVLPVGRLADALEALLKELHDQPAQLNASALRTIAAALDLLGVLIEEPLPADTSGATAPHDGEILLINGEANSQDAILSALEKAGLPATSTATPESALEKLAENEFCLVILDTETCGGDGFGFYSRLRGLPRHAATPVIFSTPLSNFRNVHSSLPDGRSDLIARPFLPMELAVKALTSTLRPR